MSPYTGPPVCQGCGGALRSDGDQCWCGGHSQYHWHTSRRDVTPDDDEPALRRLSWREAMAELRRRYVPPA
jgi:hypothetical protein